MSNIVVARSNTGKLTAVPGPQGQLTSAQRPQKKRRIKYGRPLREMFGDKQAFKPVETIPPPFPFQQQTKSLFDDILLVSASQKSIVADRVSHEMGLPGLQTPSLASLSYVTCSKGIQDETDTYSRPNFRDPVILISEKDDRPGLTDYRDTLAFELYQPGKQVESSCVISYNGLMHFQQPEFSSQLPTDTIMTQIAGSVRSESVITVKLEHERCFRYIELHIGIAQGPKNTWLHPMYMVNQPGQLHTIQLKDLPPEERDTCLRGDGAIQGNGMCDECGTGRYGTFRLNQGDRVTIKRADGTIFAPNIVLGNTIEENGNGLRFEVTPRGNCTNRHAQDISASNI